MSSSPILDEIKLHFEEVRSLHPLYVCSITVEKLEWLITRIEELQEENATLRRIPKGEVWYYGDDGEDYPESLGCPVIMEPDVLRRLLSAEKMLSDCQHICRSASSAASRGQLLCDRLLHRSSEPTEADKRSP